MSDGAKMEKIAEFVERDGGGGVVHTLSFDPVAVAFTLESRGFDYWDGDLSRTDLDSQEAFEWATEVAGMDPDEAARRIVGADEAPPLWVR